MNIVIVSDAIYPYNKGGKEKRIFELSRRYVAAGHKVDVLTMRWWKGPKTIEEHGITLHGVCSLQPLYTSDGRRSLSEAIIFGFSVFWSLLWTRFDVLEVDHIPYLPLFPARIVAWLHRKPLIATWHEVWGPQAWKAYLKGWKAVLASAIEWCSLRMPDHIISVSPLTSQRLVKELGVPSSKMITISNGISLNEIDRVAPAKEKSDLIFAGRLLRHKNIDVAIRSLHRLKKERGLTPTFFVIGDGPERKALEQLTKELSLEKQVRFWGFLEDEKRVYALMKASKLCLSPSSREGFGILALEANACGLPVITVDEPQNAMQFLIQEEKNGLVTSLNEEKLTNALERLLTSTDRLKVIKKTSHEQSRSSDWSKLSAQVLEFFERVRLRDKPKEDSAGKWWSSFDGYVAMALILSSMILALGFVQDGSFYSSDGHHYHEYAQHFIRGDFDLSHTSHPNFPSSYALLATPGIYFFHQLGFGVAFAFRVVNLFFFSFTVGLIYFLGRFFGMRRWFATMAALIFLVTPALPIAIDLWPQSLSVFSGTALIACSLLFFRYRNFLFFLLSAIVFAMILYIRTFEAIFYFPHLLLLMGGAISWANRQSESLKQRGTRILSAGLLWILVLLIAIAPLIAFNLKNYQTPWGYYYSGASKEAHHFNFAFTNLLPHWKEMIFHFSIDRPDLPAHRPMLATLESTPILIFSVLGWVVFFWRKKSFALALAWTVIGGVSFYAAFSNWLDPFTPAMRFLLVVFPLLCLLTAMGLEKIWGRVAHARAILLGAGVIGALAWMSIALAPDFFHLLIFTNIGIWSQRTEIKTLAHNLYGSFFLLALAWLMLRIFARKFSLHWVEDFFKGMIFAVVGASLLHSIYANIISAALSIRYGENVFSYFYFPFLRYIDLEFRRTIPTHFKFFFWFLAFMLFYVLSSLIFQSLKAWYEKKYPHRHTLFLSRGRRS